MAEMMTYVYDQMRAEATRLLTATGLVNAEQITLATPKPNIPADLAFPVFAAAKAAGVGNPNEFATRLAQAIVLADDGLIGSVEAAGGFVNFAVHPVRFAKAVLQQVVALGDTYGNDANVGTGQTLILEYSSPNIARKMHVGHLRTTVIGHSLHRIFQALGYQVIADNHLGDWGTQFGMLLAAIDLWKLTPWNDPDPVQTLVEIYAKYNNAAKEDPALREAGRAWFKKLEDGDSWARETWQRLIDITLVEFNRTYERLGITFDTMHGESFYEPMLASLVQDALAKGVAKVEEGGAVAVYFDDKLPSCLLRKSDGATLYQTRDAATCLYRWDNYHPTKNIYVVGQEQKLHFQQVFEIVRRLGYPEIADRSVHISFGIVTGATGERFSMRQGNVIFLEEVFDEAVTRARATMREQIAAGKTELTEDELETVGEMLGIGTVIYADLYQGPERNIKFDWDKILSPDGNTALYIQYTHARCRSILRKAAEQFPEAKVEHSAVSSENLQEAQEQAVLKQLARLPNAVREAGEKYLPATVAEWTYSLAKAINDFYQDVPVLRATTPELRAARLALVAVAAQGLKKGLFLLGIGAPERM